jgi:ribosomal protein S6--L-glutamate ligase
MVFGFTRNTNHVERLLLRPWVGSLYETYESGLRFPDALQWTTIHAAYGIPMPTTIHGLSSDRRDLEGVVERLGGFPIVIKEEGLSQGRGVALVRNFEELRLAARNPEIHHVTIARQYIRTNRSTRVVVVGNKVEFSYQYEAPPGEFRSNAGVLPSVREQECDDDARAIALKAVQVLGLTGGGVDLLRDRDGRWLLLEVNFPFNFATPDVMLKAHVAGALVESLSRSAEERFHCL